MIGAVVGGAAHAAPFGPVSVHVPVRQAQDEFPRPAMLEPNVGFWKAVFAEYSEYQSVIHSMDQPHKVWRVLDLRGEAATGGPDAARRAQIRAETRAKKELDDLLREVHALRNTPEKMSAAQREVHELFADGSDPDRYAKAVGRFRAQRGLKERTENALAVSGMYLPKMEAIFEKEGLPLGLTRLPLVESSFNVEAYSKVGAAGLWQFIPSSARIYMRLDEAVDERRDPWASTRAAAAHLKEDYQALGNWPLAVTAYNYGRAGLARGLRDVNGQTLEDLLQKWDGRRFGFASRNFYAEFLAALDIERDHHDHFGPIERHDPLDFETVRIDHYVPYEVLQRIAGTDAAAFRRLNPGYRPEVLDGRLYVPPQSTIRVPPGRAESFKVAYSTLTDEERFDQQRFYYVRYRVQRGDTLSTIAMRHGVSVSSLQQANGIRDPRSLRSGQVIRIPPRHGGRLVKVASAAEATPASGAGYVLHRVRPGQTLSAIARRYRTTIAALCELNGLRESETLFAGATLKVPSH